jgi:hypothetical protein
MNATSSNKDKVHIFLGSYDLSNALLAEHWAIKIGDTWFEIVGTSKLQKDEKNEIARHSDDSKYSDIRLLGKCDAKQVTEERLEELISRWLIQHPTYRINGDNCQLFVQFMAKELLNLDLKTQNSSYGRGMIQLGTVGAVLAVGTILAGVLVKGSHQ